MKRAIKWKIISSDERARLSTTDDSEGITYSDIEKMFNDEDLKDYNRLCGDFVNLIGDKNNIEQWDLLLNPVTGQSLTNILNSIQELRNKYALPGTFDRIWRAKP